MYTKLVTTHPNKKNMSGEISEIKVPDLTHTSTKEGTTEIVLQYYL